ncbi:MAG: glycosyltransferase [Elusimicrobia bacterium]|nr:glycosyltransferase [Candidatus Liberimonas magnetica]
MKILINLVTHRIEKLKACLGRIANNDILIVVNGYDKEIVDYLSEFKTDKLSYIVIENKIGKSKARNIGIEKSQADIIYFLDDDVFFEKDNIKILEDKYEKYPDVKIIGGPNLTPVNSSYFQRISGYIFESPFTAWKMGNRYKIKTPGDVYCDDKKLILCNLAIKKEVFDKENICFDERLYYNEENLLLEKLKEKGYKMLYSPELTVYHYRREDTFGFAKQIFASGKGRAIMTFIMPKTLSLYHIIPSLFLIYIVSLIFSPVWPVPVYVYIIANLSNSIWVTIKNRENIFSFITVFILSFIAHISYGFGFLNGLAWKKHS